MFVYSSTCFGVFPAQRQELNDCNGSLWFYLRIVVPVVLCSWSGRPAGRPDHEHSTIVLYLKPTHALILKHTFTSTFIKTLKLVKIFCKSTTKKPPHILVIIVKQSTG